jgi:hypothetical protein
VIRHEQRGDVAARCAAWSKSGYRELLFRRLSQLPEKWMGLHIFATMLQKDEIGLGLAVRGCMLTAERAVALVK